MDVCFWTVGGSHIVTAVASVRHKNLLAKLLFFDHSCQGNMKLIMQALFDAWLCLRSIHEWQDA